VLRQTGRNIARILHFVQHTGTYWYLEAMPVLLQGIADATERLFWGDAA
jgi:hypothetical protein